LQGAKAQQVDFQARVCSSFVGKKTFFKRGVALILWGKKSATKGCANNAEPIRKLYLRKLGDADRHTIDLNVLRARLAKERSLDYLT
jgi:hypothetical protein